MPGTHLTRRLLLAALAATPFAPRAGAQAVWPNRPVRVMVPYPPAGGADTTARIVFAKLGECPRAACDLIARGIGRLGGLAGHRRNRRRARVHRAVSWPRAPERLNSTTKSYASPR